MHSRYEVSDVRFQIALRLNDLARDVYLLIETTSEDNPSQQKEILRAGIMPALDRFIASVAAVMHIDLASIRKPPTSEGSGNIDRSSAL